jgi:hypothetical protein
MTRAQATGVAGNRDKGSDGHSGHNAHSAAEKIEVENVNLPGHVYRVDARKYEAMKHVMLKTLPATSPGVTLDELRPRVVPQLPEDLFPGGATAGWWVKAVQLDLEAKGVIAREKTRPLRLRRV